MIIKDLEEIKKIDIYERDSCLDELKKSVAKLCIIRDIPIEEFEYCVKDLKLLKPVKQSVVKNPDRVVQIYRDSARFFKIYNPNQLLVEDSWLKEEGRWIAHICDLTQDEKIKWKIEDYKFVNRDALSIYAGKPSKLELTSRALYLDVYPKSTNSSKIVFSSDSDLDENARSMAVKSLYNTVVSLLKSQRNNNGVIRYFDYI